MCADKKKEYEGMLPENMFWKATSARALSGAYLLFGEEELTKLMSVEHIVGLLDPAGKDLNYQVIKPADKRALLYACTQLPFFDSLRVLRLREWDKGTAQSITEDDTLKKIDPATILLIEMRGTDKSDLFYKWFLKNAKERMVPFQALTQKRVFDLLEHEAKLRQVKLGSRVMQRFMDTCGTDGFRLRNEFSKAADAVGPGGTITEEVLRKFVSPTAEAEAFTILDLLVEGKRKQGLMLLTQALKKDPKGAPFSYAGLFLSRLRPVLRARLLLDQGKKPAEVIALFGRGYYGEEIVASAQKRSAAELRRAITVFSEVNTNTVLGTADSEESLVLAIHESF